MIEEDKFNAWLNSIEYEPSYAIRRLMNAAWNAGIEYCKDDAIQQYKCATIDKRPVTHDEPGVTDWCDSLYSLSRDMSAEQKNPGIKSLVDHDYRGS